VISGTVHIGMGEIADSSKAQALAAGGFFAFPPGMTHFVSVDEDIATIPYERIERVDWSGDTFYSNSQVYCRFQAGLWVLPWLRAARCVFCSASLLS